MLCQTWILQWTCSTDLGESMSSLKIKQRTFHTSEVVLNFSQSTFSLINILSFREDLTKMFCLKIVDYSFLKTPDFTLHPESWGLNLQLSNVWEGNNSSKSNFHTPWWCMSSLVFKGGYDSKSRLAYHPDYLPINTSTSQNFSSTLMLFRKRKSLYTH